MLREKFMELNTYIRKVDSYQVKKLSLNLMIDTEEQIKSKAN